MQHKSQWIRIGCWFIVVLAVQAANAQKVWVTAQIVDNQTNRSLSASWQWIDSTGVTLVRGAASTAGFSGLVPVRARLLRVDSPGYRPMRVPVFWHNGLADSLRFQLFLPAVAIDKPAGNQPYFQSEQKALQLNRKTAGRQNLLAKVLVTDALTNQPVRAEVCLFFTRNYKKKCFEPGKTPVIQLTQPDIVALEINAPGYQRYLGNLVVDSLPARVDLPYTVRLNPMPTRLLIAASSANPSVTITRVGKPNASAVVATAPACITTVPGLYVMATQSNSGHPQTDTIIVKEGINGYVIKSPVASDSAVRTVYDVIFFAQSSYELSEEARKQLRLLAEKMHREPYRRLLVSGHTDAVGNAYLNFTLSEFRAKVTRTYLIQQGVSPNRILTEAAGQRQPAYPSDSEVNRSRNRRVELSLY